MQLFRVIAGKERNVVETEIFASDTHKALDAAFEIAAGRAFELWGSGGRICAIDPGTEPHDIRAAGPGPEHRSATQANPRHK